MEKYEPKNVCFPPNQLSRQNINSLPNNYIFEQNKANNFYQNEYQGFNNKKYNINENLNISIAITFNELESLTKENLIQLIQFINYSCSLYLKDIKFSNDYCSIFGIKENLNRNGYNIVITKNQINELHSKLRNINEYINKNNINEKFYNYNENESNFNLLNVINVAKHNYCLPIPCPFHDNIKFNSLDSYLIHCKEGHKIFTCKECGKVFEDFENFKLHIYKALNIENENININIKDNEAPPLFKNLENNIKCTKCELIFDSVEKMSIHFYEAHEKKNTETSKIDEEFKQNKEQSINENGKECSVNRIEVNENEERIENLNQKKEQNIKNEEVIKKSASKREEEMEIIKEISKENSNKKDSKYLQRKRNYDKEEEIFIKKEEIKRKEESKSQDNIKRKEKHKEHEELKRQKELKNQKEMKIEEEFIKQEDLKEEKEINNDGFYFICFCDNNIFSTQKLYFEHFRKNHSNICCICGKKFTSKNSLQNHYNFKNKNHSIIKCKLCGKDYYSISALQSHCEKKNH